MLSKPLSIIGLDPGTTTAAVILGLDGKMLLAFSGKELSLSEVITRAVEVSLPVFAATDKSKVPSFVDEFSRKTGAKLCFPEEDLAKEEKRNLVQEFIHEDTTRNTHEFDSLAAALYAYKKLLPRLNKIANYLSLTQLHDKGGEFTLIALREPQLNFNDIKAMLTKPTEEHKILHKVIAEQKINKSDFLRLYQQFNDKIAENNMLQNKLNSKIQESNNLKHLASSLGKRKDSFNQRIDSLLKFKEDRLKLQEKELQRSHKIVSELNEHILQLYQFISLVPKYQLLKKLDSLSAREFELKQKILNLSEGDVLLVKDANQYSEQAVEKLVKLNAVIVSVSGINKLVKSKLATSIILPQDVILDTEYFVLISPERINLISIKKEEIDLLIKEYRETRKTKLS